VVAVRQAPPDTWFHGIRAIKPGYPQLVKAGFPAVVGK